VVATLRPIGTITPLRPIGALRPIGTPIAGAINSTLNGLRSRGPRVLRHDWLYVDRRNHRGGQHHPAELRHPHDSSLLIDLKDIRVLRGSLCHGEQNAAEPVRPASLPGVFFIGLDG
jgi:hypothetical protein